ncbi:DMT family transporter [Cloacibacillus sp. An23]|uniref:DMT family transporter n=1 Tax=Cloacibacillus sp. An23 TaxID=1965591 RepID=UPI000B39D246|nr:DMT family transporter [Cloacibacillus sp. An23]OUO94360.1 hypothetical protein B5F39_03805 [Cloacibacillus sp. An23]
MKLNNYWRGAALALTAAVCWGIISPIAKVLGAAGIDLMSVMVYRSLFTFAASGLFLFLTHGAGDFRVERGYLRFYIISGTLSVAFAGGGFLTSLEYLSVAEALVVHYTFPLGALAGSLYITHERPTALQCAAGVLIVLGVFIGMGGSVHALMNISLPGLFWGLLAVVGMSGQALVTRRFSLEHKVDEFKLLFFSNAVGLFILFVFKTKWYGWGDLANFDAARFALMNVQAFTGSFIAYGVFFAALKCIPAAMASLLCTMEIVVAVVLTAVFVHQIPSVHEVIGCALILIAIACTAAPSRGFSRK